jgi:YD repeat-containing protein
VIAFDGAITASNAKSHFSAIRDTLGKAATFSYDYYGYLDSVESYGKARATITFNHTIQGYIYTPDFSVPKQLPSVSSQLDSIAISTSDRTLIQEYTYWYVGEIGTITNRVQKDEEDISSLIATYYYGTMSFADPTYTSVQERVVGYGFMGEITLNNMWRLYYSYNGNRSNPAKTTVEDMRGKTEYNFNSSVYPARSWSDGLISSVQRKSLDLATVYGTQSTDWEQDISGTFVVNPRPIRQTTTLDDGKTFKTEYVYTTDGTGNVSQAIQYKFGNAEVLRSTVNTYYHESNSAYATANLTNLPASVSIRDGNNTEVARTEYAYDEYSLSTYPGTIYQQHPSYNNQNITVRGNQTSVKNKYIEQSRFLVTTSHYDSVGNVVSVTDPKSNPPTTITYWSDTNYVLPRYTSNALGHQTQRVWQQYDGDGFTFYNGDLYTSTDPNGYTTTYYYDELGRNNYWSRPGSAGAQYDYDDLYFLTTEMGSSGTKYTKTDSMTNPTDAGHVDPAGGADIQTEAIYNNPWGQPDYIYYPHRYGETMMYTAHMIYDPMGRLLSRGEAGQSSMTTAYNYSGNEITVTGAESKQVKYTYDENGNISQVMDMDDSGNLTLATTYSYNLLGKLTQIVQVGQGSQPNQTRSYSMTALDE